MIFIMLVMNEGARLIYGYWGAIFVFGAKSLGLGQHLWVLRQILGFMTKLKFAPSETKNSFKPTPTKILSKMYDFEKKN